MAELQKIIPHSCYTLSARITLGRTGFLVLQLSPTGACLRPLNMSIFQSLNGRRHCDDRWSKLVLEGTVVVILDSPLARSLLGRRDSCSDTYFSQPSSPGHLITADGGYNKAEVFYFPVEPRMPVPLYLILPDFDEHEDGTPSVESSLI